MRDRSLGARILAITKALLQSGVSSQGYARPTAVIGETLRRLLQNDNGIEAVPDPAAS